MSKIALVTGGGSGIGRNATLTLASAGYTVVATGRRLDALEETAQQANGTVVPVASDVSDEASVAALFETIQASHGRLDVLFNNAGTNVASTNFGDLTMTDWNHVINVNLNGAFLVANLAYRMMRDQSPQGGRIINNGD